MRCLSRCSRSDVPTEPVRLLQEALESFPRKLGEPAHRTLSGVVAHEASYMKEIETQRAALQKRGVKGKGDSSLP